MNPKELNFAYKVRHALNETTENLPTATTDRLSAARTMALSRQKHRSSLRMLAPQVVIAGQVGGFVSAPLSWLGLMGLLLPLIVVAIGLTGIYEYERQRRINDTAEIDAAVLSDELPLSAYVDHGFNAYLATRGE